MIPSALRVTLIIGVLCYFIIILFYLKKRMLDLKYTLIWIFAGLIMGILVFFPTLLHLFIRLLGIEDNMNGLFILLFAFCILVLMTLTAIASRTSMKLRTLIQEIAVLEKRVRELEEETNSKK